MEDHPNGSQNTVTSARTWIEDTWKSKEGTDTAVHGRGNRWRGYWYETSPTSSGAGTRRRARLFRTKIEAQRFLADVAHRQRTNAYLPPERGETTFAESAEEWLSSSHHLKASTRYRYTRELRTYVLPKWGHRQVGTLNRREIQAWISELVDGTAPASYKSRANGLSSPDSPGVMRMPLSPNSIKHRVHIVSAVLNWCVESEILTANPASKLRAPRPQTIEHIYLNFDEVDALALSAFDVTANETDRSLVYLLAYTGLRINEALALRVSSLDFVRGRIQVKQAWTSDADGRAMLGTPKSGKARTVGAPSFLWGTLQELTVGRDRNDFVFQAPRGGPMSDHNWRTRVFNLARDLAGLEPGLTPHKLRHTAASMAIAAGADVKLVQQMLGHADATETLNTYSHLWPDRIDEISTKLEAARIAALAASSLANVPEMSPIAKMTA